MQLYLSYFLNVKQWMCIKGNIRSAMFFIVTEEQIYWWKYDWLIQVNLYVVNIMNPTQHMV